MWSTCPLPWWVTDFDKMERSTNLSSFLYYENPQSELIPFQGVGAIETQAVYVATKYFIEGLSKSLRKEGLLDGVKVRYAQVKVYFDLKYNKISGNN